MIGPIAIGMALSIFALHALGMSWVRAAAGVIGIVSAAAVLMVTLEAAVLR